MQRFRWLIVLGSLCLVTPLIHADAPSSSILTEEDYDLESASREDGPALSSPLSSKDQWKSFNEWRCYRKRAVELICTEIDYDGGWRKSPTIIATADGHRFEYDLDPTIPWDCEFTLNEWRQAIDGSAEVCLFAAYLQPLEEDASLWVLDRIKSERGHWEEYQSAAYDHASHEPKEIGSEEEGLSSE